MNKLLSITLLLSTLTGFAQDIVQCHSLDELDKNTLCIPSIGQGKRLILLKAANTSSAFPNLSNIISPESKAEQFLFANYPQTEFLMANPLLGKMGNLFNQSAGFGGPNCYHNALNVTNAPYSSELRYVSPEEFELTLKLAYEKVDQPQFGDIVVYEAKSERGHAAVYLFDQLVFHKKSYQKEYLYRISPLHDVAQAEPFEWTPRPDSQSSRALEGMSTNDIAFYRKKGNPISLDLGDPKEENKIALINEIGNQVVTAAPQWKMGAFLGLTTENLVEELVRDFDSMKNHPSTLVKMNHARLISYRDQIFQSLEDSYFSSPLSSSRVERINQEICVVETPQFKSIIEKLLKAYERPTTEESINKVMEALRKQDKKACRFSLLQIIKKI